MINWNQSGFAEAYQVYAGVGQKKKNRTQLKKKNEGSVDVHNQNFGLGCCITVIQMKGSIWKLNCFCQERFPLKDKQAVVLKKSSN